MSVIASQYGTQWTEDNIWKWANVSGVNVTDARYGNTGCGVFNQGVQN